MSFYQYLQINWALVLVLIAMVVMAITTVQFNKKEMKVMFIAAALILVLSIADYIETYLSSLPTYSIWRSVLSAVKYAIPSWLFAMIAYAFLKSKWYIFIPAFILSVLCIVSIWTNIIFGYHTDSNTFMRGPIGYLPFVVSGLYLAYFPFCIFRSGRKTIGDIVSVTFIILSVVAIIIMPIVFDGDFDHWLSTTIAICILVYYLFNLQQLANRDALTGLLNRQSFYKEIRTAAKFVTGAISIDLNGLKAINDEKGHEAGDKALKAVSRCFLTSLSIGQRAFRLGGDEFVIICRGTHESDVKHLVERIEHRVKNTPYTISIGYSVKHDDISLKDMLREADRNMYENKKKYYKTQKTGDLH